MDVKEENAEVKVSSEVKPDLDSFDMDEDVDDEDLPPNVRSFLDEMKQLDEMTMSKRKPGRSQSKRSTSNKKKSEEEKKKDSHRYHKKSSHRKDDEKKHERRKSKDSDESHKAKKHDDASKHKSSNKIRKETKETEVFCENSDESLPDLSAELDMLPDELNDFQDEQTEIAHDDDLFDDEDDELRRIFSEYQPEVKTDVSSLKKAKRLEEEEAAKVNKTEEPVFGGKKRLAHTGANEGSKKQIVKKANKRLTPHEVLMNRYKTLQVINQYNFFYQSCLLGFVSELFGS